MTNQVPILEGKSIQAGYGQIRALRGIDLAVRESNITAVVGANGAGKTTLLQTLIGAHNLTDGAVTYKGANLGKSSPAHRVRDGLVLVPEGRGIVPDMTVTDNLLLGRDASGGRDKSSKFTLNDIYGRFDILGRRRNQSAGLLSGGEQQMLAIGRALLSQPTVLMLDEPSLGLAPKITQEVMHLLATLRDDGLTILLVEQNVRQAMKIADSYYLLGTGSVVASGSASDAGEEIQAAYLGGT